MAMSAEAYQEVETATCLLSGCSSLASRIGRVCLAALFSVRMGILIVGCRTVWGDEENDFYCNTTRLLCKPSCFDEFSPISSFNLFTLHVIALLTHSVCVSCYGRLAYQEKEGWFHAQLRKKTVQMKLYIISLISRVLIEGLFMFTFYKITEGFVYKRTIRCQNPLCEPFVVCSDINSTIKDILNLCYCAASVASAMVCFWEFVICLTSVQQVKKPSARQSHTKKQRF